MAFPPLIFYFAQKMGKSVSAFTKDDWKRAAITAAEWYDTKIPVPGKRGRPRKYRPGETLNKLLGIKPKKPKRGRPLQKYGPNKVRIDVVAKLIDDALSEETKKKWPEQAPRTQIAAARSVLKAIEVPAGYAESVLRSVRAFRKQSAGKSQHNSK